MPIEKHTQVGLEIVRLSSQFGSGKRKCGVRIRRLFITNFLNDSWRLTVLTTVAVVIAIVVVVVVVIGSVCVVGIGVNGVVRVGVGVVGGDAHVGVGVVGVHGRRSCESNSLALPIAKGTGKQKIKLTECVGI